MEKRDEEEAAEGYSGRTGERCGFGGGWICEDTEPIRERMIGEDGSERERGG